MHPLRQLWDIGFTRTLYITVQVHHMARTHAACANHTNRYISHPSLPFSRAIYKLLEKAFRNEGSRRAFNGLPPFAFPGAHDRLLDSGHSLGFSKARFSLLAGDDR